MIPKNPSGLIKVTVIAAMLCCSTLLCLAQADRGSLTGTIADTAGSVIPGAAVTATNSATGAQNSTVTTAAGEYVIPGLPTGSYSLTVEATGFTKLIHSGITVSVSTVVHLDLNLAVGSATSTVTVTGDAALLNTDSPQNNILVTASDFNELPINMAGVGAIRDPLAFAQLAPGTTVGSWNDIHIDGAPGWTYRILLDGQDNGSPLTIRSSDEWQPSVEALQEFSLQQDSYPAEFGQALGGVYNYTTKSGANKFHGALFNYLENEALNAGEAFNYNPDGSKVVPKSRELDFGGAIGGPVWIPHVYDGHNKTFFFFSYEMYRDTVLQNDGLQTVPTVANRNGDFSYLLNGTIQNNGVPILDCLGRQMTNGAIYDPATSRVATCTNGSTAVVRDPFPNNFINPMRFDPVAAKVLNLIPLPAGPTAANPSNNYPVNIPANKYQWIPSIKMDHNVSSALHLSGFFAEEQTDKQNQGNGLPNPISSLVYQTIHGLVLHINADYVISPSLVVHAGFGWSRYNNPQFSAITNFNQQAELGLTTQANLPGNIPLNFPSITGLNVNNSGVNSMGAQEQRFIINKPEFLGSLTWVRGKHDYKFGGDFRHEAYSNENNAGADGSYAFAPDQTSLPSSYGQNLNGGSLGNGFASFVLGGLNNASIQNFNAPWYIRKIGAVFAQDTWKVTPKLTLNYGLRWDLQQLHHEEQYREAVFSATVANPSVGGLPGGTEYEGYGPGRCNCVFEKFYPWMIQPRIGILYQIERNTVAHVASGIYSGQQTFEGESPSSQGFNWNTISIFAPSYGIAAGQFADGVPYTTSQITALNLNPGYYPNEGQLNAAPSAIHPTNGRPPRMVQTNIGIQHAFGKNLTIEGAWVDIRGVWLEANGLVDLNQLNPSRIAQHGLDITNPTDFALLASPISSPSVAARGFTAPYAGFPTGSSLAQALRPFPQFSSLSTIYADIGNWWYDAGQFKLTKRFSQGFSILASYTWSKDLGTADAGATVPIQDASLPYKSQKTYLSIDNPQSTTFSFRYEFPTFGFAETGWRRLLFKGWTTDGIFNYHSGFPMQVPNSTNSITSVTFAPNNFANRVPNQPLFLHSLNSHKVNPLTTFFLNPSAWSNPATGTYSTSKPYYGDYRTPRYPNEQLGLGKSLPIKEGVTFSVRADFFNVFNRWAYPPLNNTSSPFTTPQYAANGTITNGFGFFGASIASAAGVPSPGSTAAAIPPRSGEIVARIQF
jgi:hypothetical protein